MLPITDPRVERGLPEEIESKLSLWEQQVPEVWGKSGIDASRIDRKWFLNVQMARSA